MILGHYTFVPKNHLAYGDVVLLTKEEASKKIPRALYTGGASNIPKEIASHAEVIWANEDSIKAFESYAKTNEFLYDVGKRITVSINGGKKSGYPNNSRKRAASVRENRSTRANQARSRG